MAKLMLNRVDNFNYSYKLNVEGYFHISSINFDLPDSPDKYYCRYIKVGGSTYSSDFYHRKGFTNTVKIDNTLTSGEYKIEFFVTEYNSNKQIHISNVSMNI